MFFDLNKFKPVNDQLGHAVGDKLLKEVAQRLKNTLRESDTVGRYGGDEFVAILEEANSRDRCVVIAEKIGGRIRQPFRIDGHEISIGVSIGIALFPVHGEDAKTLMTQADQAMYQAKRHETKDYEFAVAVKKV